MNNYIEILKKLNKRSLKNGDVPVSCIIIKNNKIVSKSYNKKYKNNNPFYHAEIVAIIKAAKKLKTPNLSDCIMITTLQPCKMCKSVIEEAKIKKIYYILDNNKICNYKNELIKIDDEKDYFKKELSDFFVSKR